MLCMNFTYNLDIKFLTVTAEKWIIMSSLSEYVPRCEEKYWNCLAFIPNITTL